MYVYQCSWSHCWLQWVHVHADTNVYTLACPATYIHNWKLKHDWYQQTQMLVCWHTFMHTYIHTYMHTYIHACLSTYIHIYLHGNMHAYTCAYLATHAYIHTYICTTYTDIHAVCMPACLHTNISMCIQHICMYALINTCIHTYIHMCVQNHGCVCMDSYTYAWIHTCIHTHMPTCIIMQIFMHVC